MHLALILAVLTELAFAADPQKPGAPTPEQQIAALKIENAKLTDRIEQMQKSFHLEMQIAGGALQACREIALKPAEKPAPK